MTIEEIYGGYMTYEAAEKVLTSAEHCIAILRLRRNDLVAVDVCDPRIDETCKALSFWEDIEKQYKEFLDESKV